MKWRFCCAVLVLIVGVFLPLSPASTWTRSGDDTTGAPAVAPGQDGLVEARKAAGEASAQAGFLTQGTGQLVDGVSQLDTSSQELINAIAAAQTGSQELSNGMVQLQAGTGQLAGGATQVADAIGGVADQVAGFDAVRGQVVATIDRTLESTKDAKDPDVKEARTALEGLRGQAETAQLPPEMLGQLEELRKGSRDVANQLSVPGYAYHDGIYSATNGAAELANGLTTLNDQASGATDGVTQLQEGAAKIDDMANKTSDQIAAVRKAMPAAAGAGAGAGSSAGAGASEAPAPRSTLAPVAAMLIAALVMLGGTATGAAARLAPARRWWILGFGGLFVAAAGGALVAVLGSGLTAATAGLLALGLVVGVAASAGLTDVLSAALGTRVGLPIAGVLAVAQVGLVGWLWRTASTAPVGKVWEYAAGATPMHWTTASLSAAGNGGSTTALWAGTCAGLVLAVVSFAGAKGRG
ncbi:hypothetical protein FPH17_05255 [Corynebacterium godavarianum]|uniref:X-X-X-Leu-X-X-Gly heptad repeat-containing protein n=1 Tax=Corynebacterium godavarianum TaxID=2054421 RepID=A0ABY3E596_9CORY|nr:hypothetical protein [Corynebacterium godavarianum]MBL7284932.1 hypothetical protein [Corynebacterium godavarianum]TSJ74860.1 hypothetical protein FPH17_05255 [Corynebacterium godavarianum]